MDSSHHMTLYPEQNELWRECASWLTKWQMLREDHRSNWSNACIADLANILRDGVLLCKLLNKIEPGALDMKDVNLKPTLAQFLCLRNINLFLKTCMESFGLKQSDLFEDIMLFDLTNFHKVLYTMSKLSQSPKALRSGIPGFSVHRLNTKEEEIIYQSLKREDMVVNVPSIMHHGCGLDKTSEEIYQDLCVDRTTSEEPLTFEKRDFVIKELLDTEKNYVDVLSKLKKNYMIPLMNQMTREHHATVFFKIKELKDIHSEFLHELLIARDSTTLKLSTVFMKWREKFLVYGMYCANLTRATSLLEELCKNNEGFNQAVNKYEKEDNNGRFKLRDVLSVPMQRILKYHLLLEKLIENTDPNHEEYNELRRSREAMLDVAGYINEAARDSEHLEVINHLQDTITDWNFGPNQKLSEYGRLLKDASLKIKAHDDQKTRNRYIFIFDRCILICKQLKGNLFGYRELINITDYHVEEIHNRPVLNQEARMGYQFVLVKNDSQNAYTLSVRSVELKQKIMKAITDALDNIHPKTLQCTSHLFELQTFIQPVQCFYCSKYLKGLICQGYKCSSCDMCVHKVCIQFAGKCGSSQPVIKSHEAKTDCRLSDKLWFVGDMDRNTASMKLDKRENGTFLVRIRPQSEDNDKFALTLKTDSSVKHMKICCKIELPNNTRKYYLSQSKYFSSIEELVMNYQIYSLKENFERLHENTKLCLPYRQLRAVALKSYESKDENQLSLSEDQKVIVIGQEGYKDGWWKVRNEHKEVGFVPWNILKVEGDVVFDT